MPSMSYRFPIPADDETGPASSSRIMKVDLAFAAAHDEHAQVTVRTDRFPVLSDSDHSEQPSASSSTPPLLQQATQRAGGIATL